MNTFSYMKKAEEDARLLIAETAQALARGVRHFNKAGKPLTTVRAILETLVKEGSVTFLEPVSGDEHVDV